MTARDLLTDPATAKAAADFTSALWLLALWWMVEKMAESTTPSPD